MKVRQKFQLVVESKTKTDVHFECEEVENAKEVQLQLYNVLHIPEQKHALDLKCECNAQCKLYVASCSASPQQIFLLPSLNTFQQN